MANFFTSKQVTIIIICVTAIFIMCGIMTLVIDSSDSDNETTETVKTDNGYQFDIKSEGVDDVATDSTTIKTMTGIKSRLPEFLRNDLTYLPTLKKTLPSVTRFSKLCLPRYPLKI